MNKEVKLAAACVMACFLAACATGPRTVAEDYTQPTEGPRATLTYKLRPHVVGEANELVGLVREDCATLKQLKAEKAPVYHVDRLFRVRAADRLAGKIKDDETVVLQAGKLISLNYGYSAYYKDQLINGALKDKFERCRATLDVQLEDGKAYDLIGGTMPVKGRPGMFCQLFVVETKTQIPVLPANRCPDK